MGPRVGAGEKLVLSELLQPIRPKSALSSVKKELSRVKQKKAVELPLSKEEAKRVSGPVQAAEGGSGLTGPAEPLRAPLLLSAADWLFLSASAFSLLAPACRS